MVTFPNFFPKAMRLPEAAFWREASTIRWEPEAAIRLQPNYIFSNGNYYCFNYCAQLLRVLRPSSSR